MMISVRSAAAVINGESKMTKHVLMMLVAAAVTSAFALVSGLQRDSGGPEIDGSDAKGKIFERLA